MIRDAVLSAPLVGFCRALLKSLLAMIARYETSTCKGAIDLKANMPGVQNGEDLLPLGPAYVWDEA